MEDEQKVRIGGIKFSEELVQVEIVCRSPELFSICPLLTQIADKNINIPFLCHSQVTNNSEIVFCVHRSMLGETQQILNTSSLQDSQISITPSIGTLTIFPHRNQLSLLGRITNFFGTHKYPIHSLSTSISAIALNTDYFLLDIIAEKLQYIFELPENHAPFRQGFRVTQIQL